MRRCGANWRTTSTRSASTPISSAARSGTSSSATSRRTRTSSFAASRKEVSTGPGRHDFEIVADASLSVEEDMRRRDFTINAIARRLSTGEIVDPLNGRKDLERRVLRTVSSSSFAEDPLRLVRALRFVSQLGFDLDDLTLEQMRAEAKAVRLVSGERIGGGLAADGMGELSKLLLGREPARALRLARDTGLLIELLPEFG